MTLKLEERLQTIRPPFNGNAVVTCNKPDLGIIRQILLFTCDHLKAQYDKIFTYHDWHEHDGYTTTTVPYQNR